MYPPPENGALACNAFGVSNQFCQVSCNDQYDFAFPPAITYLCTNGLWTALGGQPPPWPRCSGEFILCNMKGFRQIKEARNAEESLPRSSAIFFCIGSLTNRFLN